MQRMIALTPHGSACKSQKVDIGAGCHFSKSARFSDYSVPHKLHAKGREGKGTVEECQNRAN